MSNIAVTSLKPGDEEVNFEPLTFKHYASEETDVYKPSEAKLLVSKTYSGTGDDTDSVFSYNLKNKARMRITTWEIPSDGEFSQRGVTFSAIVRKDRESVSRYSDHFLLPRKNDIPTEDIISGIVDHNARTFDALEAGRSGDGVRYEETVGEGTGNFMNVEFRAIPEDPIEGGGLYTHIVLEGLPCKEVLPDNWRFETGERNILRDELAD